MDVVIHMWPHAHIYTLVKLVIHMWPRTYMCSSWAIRGVYDSFMLSLGATCEVRDPYVEFVIHVWSLWLHVTSHMYVCGPYVEFVIHMWR